MGLPRRPWVTWTKLSDHYWLGLGKLVSVLWSWAASQFQPMAESFILNPF
jgi:hypothetical protein